MFVALFLSLNKKGSICCLSVEKGQAVLAIRCVATPIWVAATAETHALYFKFK